MASLDRLSLRSSSQRRANCLRKESMSCACGICPRCLVDRTAGFICQPPTKKCSRHRPTPFVVPSVSQVQPCRLDDPGRPRTSFLQAAEELMRRTARRRMAYNILITMTLFCALWRSASKLSHSIGRSHELRGFMALAGPPARSPEFLRPPPARKTAT